MFWQNNNIWCFLTLLSVANLGHLPPLFFMQFIKKDAARGGCMYTECRVIVHISIQYHRPNSVRRCWNIKLRIFLLTRSDLKVATTKKFATGSFHQLSVPSPDPREQEQIVHERFWTIQGFICQLRRSWTVHYRSSLLPGKPRGLNDHSRQMSQPFWSSHHTSTSFDFLCWPTMTNVKPKCKPLVKNLPPSSTSFWSYGDECGWLLGSCLLNGRFIALWFGLQTVENVTTYA